MRTVAYILSIVSILFLCSCEEKGFSLENNDDNNITITISSQNLKVKSTMEGTGNENIIKSLYYFFYPVNPDSPSEDPTLQNASHWGKVTYDDISDTRNIRIRIPETDFNNKIFPGNHRECEIFVIANLPEEIVINDETDKSLPYLNSLALSGEFGNVDVNGNINGLIPEQECFIMTKSGTISITENNGEGKDATGEIMLERIASKLSINVNITGNTSENNEIWSADPTNMTISFYNGMNNAVISGDPSDVVNPILFTLKNLGGNTQARSGETPGSTTSFEPFYTYPIKWNIGAETEPYFIIMLPWRNESTQSAYVNTYYKVVLAGDNLKRNTWTDLTVNLSTMGDNEEFPDLKVPISDINYQVIDWGTGKQVESIIGDYRYIVVDRNYYEINNKNELMIPFTSSHDCEIVNISVTRPNFNKDTEGNGMKEEQVSSKKLEEFNIEKYSVNSIRFCHQLNNDITNKDVDFAPYTINFRIVHSDNSKIFRDVTIIQNPAMLISNEKNPGGNVLDSKIDPNATGYSNIKDKGYVFVNGNQLYNPTNDPDDEAGRDWNLVRNLLDGGNKNPNMYIISSTIPFGENIISDPREMKPVAYENIGFTNEAQRPQNYYKTDETNESQNIIAPKFRIASSYGKVYQDISKDYARKRCAAYQERGYPAGRWRLPTLAELKFIATLSNYKFIPELFSADNYYWTATGAILYGNDMKILPNRTKAAVRCVYDEWYWENSNTPKVVVEEFSWGDEPR